MTPDEIKALRAALGYSQGRLAQEIGVAHQTVAAWEQGRNSVPAPVAKLLGLMKKSLDK